MNTTELNLIQQKALSRGSQGLDRTTVRIATCMATGGLAAGAQSVVNTIREELQQVEGVRVQVVRKGCIGMCRLDPLVDVLVPGEDKVTYVKMTPEKIRHVIHQHIVHGQIVHEYTLHVANDIILNDYALIDG